jgi:crossover junction endodeoxyribonuclease RusA
LNIATITVPLTPPSVNHYAKHTRSGRHYVTAEAHSYLSAVGLFSRNQRVRGKAYKVELWIYLGKRQKLDLDNASKCPLDGLVKAGVIDTDAKIVNLHLYKRRDSQRPRTEMVIEVIEP